MCYNGKSQTTVSQNSLTVLLLTTRFENDYMYYFHNQDDRVRASKVKQAMRQAAIDALKVYEFTWTTTCR